MKTLTTPKHAKTLILAFLLTALSVEHMSAQAQDHRIGYPTSSTTSPVVGSYTTETAGAQQYYLSACVSFTAEQMAPYVGCELLSLRTNRNSSYITGLHTISPITIWVKATLDGPILHETTLGTVGNATTWTTHTFTTPYIITEGPLIIGYSIRINNNAGSKQPHRYEAGTWQEGAFYKTDGNNDSYREGAQWTVDDRGALLLFADLFGEKLPEKDLAATSVTSLPLKWTNNPTTYSVNVLNNGVVSQNNFTVQLLDDDDNVLGTETVTTALAAGASRDIEISYTPTTVGSLTVKGKVILEGDENPANNVSDPLTQYVYSMQPMHYCDNSTL
ncbi:MAG: hypothetical protein FWG79_07965, partial [Bacteroidales bacterium]|nr:hypothetical protein [Bacteroidales bacterium]